MTTLQLSASFGEMFCPFIMGIAFQLKAYPLFYLLMLGWQVFVMLLLIIPWMLLTRRLPLSAALLRRLGGRGGSAERDSAEIELSCEPSPIARPQR